MPSLDRRYRRVNIDGESITETRLATAALKPGTFATINNTTDKFQVAVIADAPKRLYVIEPATHQGLTITDDIPINNSAVGNYVDDGREFAIRFAQGAVIKKDDPISVTAAGYGVKATQGTDVVVAYAQETVTLAGGGGDDFIRCRMHYRAVS